MYRSTLSTVRIVQDCRWNREPCYNDALISIAIFRIYSTGYWCLMKSYCSYLSRDVPLSFLCSIHNSCGSTFAWAVIKITVTNNSILKIYA